MRYRNLIVVIFFLFAYDSSGHEYFTNIQSQALANCIKLKLDLADELNNQSDPRSLPTLLIADYIDFLKAALSETENDYHTYRLNRDRRVDSISKIKRTDPFVRYVLGEIYFHTAIIDFKMGHEIEASFALVKSYRLLEENQKLFPTFLYHRKTLGLYHVILGVVPDKYYWLIRFMGLQSNSQEGIVELESVIRSNNEVSKEASMFLQIVNYFVFEDKRKALSVAETFSFATSDNLAEAYLHAALLYKERLGDKALNIRYFRIDSSYARFPYVDYLLGNLYLHKLEVNKSKMHFDLFLQKFKGRNYKSDVYYKMALLTKFMHQNTKSEDYRVLAVAQAYCLFENDRNAQRLAKAGLGQNVKLLQSRLLFDGGYYERALLAIDSCDINDRLTHSDSVERDYRKARIYHQLQDYSIAVKYYKRCIFLQKEKHLYFAPNACLQLGYLHKNEPAKALQYLKNVFNYDGYQYQSGIESKARKELKNIQTGGDERVAH